MSEFNSKFNQTLNIIGGTLGMSESDIYSKNIELSIENAINSLNSEAKRRTNVDENYLKGWLAEQWHSETFNINKTVKQNSDVWSKVANNNKSGEDIYFGNSESSNIAELKYYKNGENTAKAISHPDYINKEKIVPSDQLKKVSEFAEKKSNSIESYRPEQAKNYQDTANRASDRLSIDDIESKPLSEDNAKKIAKDYKKNDKIDADKYSLNSENFVTWKDIAKQSGEAALHAAILSAAISSAPQIWKIINEYINDEKIDINSLSDKGATIINNSSNATLRGGIAAVLTSACRTGLLGRSLKHISPTAIGFATTMTINSIEYSLKLYQGKISKSEFVNFCIRDSFILTSAISGAVVGQMVIPIPLLGALIGNLVGASIGSISYQYFNNTLLGLSVKNGWTYFNLVNQNYTVNEDVLKSVGYDTINLKAFQVDNFEIDEFEVEQFCTNENLVFIPLKRGVIKPNFIGYI